MVKIVSKDSAGANTLFGGDTDQHFPTGASILKDTEKVGQGNLKQSLMMV